MEKKIKDPKVKELKERISKLISHHTKRKDDAIAFNQQLYRKKDSLTEMEWMEKLPPQFSEAFFTAYFIREQATYSNYQKEHLELNKFDKESYLNRLEKEVVISEKNAGFVVDNEIGLPKDYPLFVLYESEEKKLRSIGRWKQKLLELAQAQAEKMWEENIPDEVFGLDVKTYIDLTTKELYDRLIKKYFYDRNKE